LGENSNASVVVYPNPASSILNVNVDEEVSSFIITTLDGKVVANYSDTKSIHVADLNSGMYLYQVTTVSGKTAKGNFIKN
jgi:hypothetical protein